MNLKGAGEKSRLFHRIPKVVFEFIAIFSFYLSRVLSFVNLVLWTNGWMDGKTDRHNEKENSSAAKIKMFFYLEYFIWIEMGTNFETLTDDEEIRKTSVSFCQCQLAISKLYASIEKYERNVIKKIDMSRQHAGEKPGQPENTATATENKPRMKSN